MNLLSKFVAGLSIGVAATGGCYAFAATAAAHLAASVAPETARHGRMANRARTETAAHARWKAIEAWAAAGARAPRAS